MDVAALEQPAEQAFGFENRRNQTGDARPSGLPERRQFQDARTYANPDAAELAEAIDSYKLTHRRRFITYEELFDVISRLGFRKVD
jgi:hypothetical protein